MPRSLLCARGSGSSEDKFRVLHWKCSRWTPGPRVICVPFTAKHVYFSLRTGILIWLFELSTRFRNQARQATRRNCQFLALLLSAPKLFDFLCLVRFLDLTKKKTQTNKVKSCRRAQLPAEILPPIRAPSSWLLKWPWPVSRVFRRVIQVFTTEFLSKDTGKLLLHVQPSAMPITEVSSSRHGTSVNLCPIARCESHRGPAVMRLQVRRITGLCTWPAN